MPVNFEILRGYLNHDEAMVKRFLSVVCEALPDDLLKLKSYLLAKDFELSSITAHSIKTQCAYLGLNEAQDLAYKIELVTTENSRVLDWSDALNEMLMLEITRLKMTLDFDKL
jgi:HPt (histidine-containing phosphotransfer) domain-containing protein